MNEPCPTCGHGDGDVYEAVSGALAGVQFRILPDGSVRVISPRA